MIKPRTQIHSITHHCKLPATESCHLWTRLLPRLKLALTTGRFPVSARVNGRFHCWRSSVWMLGGRWNLQDNLRSLLGAGGSECWRGILIMNRAASPPERGLEQPQDDSPPSASTSSCLALPPLSSPSVYPPYPPPAPASPSSSSCFAGLHAYDFLSYIFPITSFSPYPFQFLKVLLLKRRLWQTGAWMQDSLRLKTDLTC